MNYSTNILPKVVETIKASSIVAAQDVKFHSSIDRQLGQRFETSAKSLLDLANNLLKQMNPNYDKVTPDDNCLSLSSWKNIEDTLDVSFESVEYIMESMKTLQKGKSLLSSLETENSYDFKSVNIEKPQLHFKDVLDNFDTQPFRPKLKSKPNAKMPLREVLESERLPDGRFPHPYEKEIKESDYPEWLFEDCEPHPSNNWENTLATWVNNKDSLKEMINDLKLLDLIAVDLEHHDYRSYYGITCLMQISNRQFDWIVDTIALRDELHVLNEIFTDPKIVKVFHGANMDIVWLQRDLGLYVVSLFDTYHASKALGFPKFSLAYLLEEFAKFRTSKKYQLADWRVRPLPKVLFEYARADTHFLLNIFDKLRNKLVADNGEKLKHVLDQSRLVACRKFEYKKFRVGAEEWSSFDDRDAESRFISQNNIPTSQRQLVRYLMELRDELARTLDESIRFILPNQVLLNLCTLPNPVTQETLKRTLGHCAPNFEEHLNEIIRAINDSHSSTKLSGDTKMYSDESTARHYAELYIRMQDIGRALSVSSDSLIQQSSLVPQILKLSSLEKNYLARNKDALHNVYEALRSKQETLNPNSAKNNADNESSKPSSTEPKVTSPDSVYQEESEVLKPLRRRAVVPSNFRAKGQDDISTFNYNDVPSTVLDSEPKRNTKRKSYDPNNVSIPSNIKKPKTRRGFQSGKSTSFSKTGKSS